VWKEGEGRTTNKSGIILTKRRSYSLCPYSAAAALPLSLYLVTQRPKQEQRPREQQGEGQGVRQNEGNILLKTLLHARCAGVALGLGCCKDKEEEENQTEEFN
jgi:hypothetical protein